MTEPDPADPIATARDLTEALTNMATELKAVNKRVARTWHMVWGLVFSLVIDLALTVVVAVFAVQAHNASDNARNARAVAHVAAQSNLALCLSSNHARAQQVDLWDYLLSLGTAPKTAAERKVIAEFKAHLLVIFAPRDCTHIASGKP